MTRRGWLLFATLSLVWGVPYLLIKVAVEDLSPSVVVFGRCATAALVLLPLAAARHELRPALRAWRWVAVLALVEIIGPFGLLAVAETRLTSSTTGVLIATVPLMAALATWRLGLDARPGLRRSAGLLIGFVGVVVLVGADLRGGDLVAALAVLAAAVGYTAGPLVIATRLRGVPPLGVITGAMLVSALVYALPAVRTWPDDAAPASGPAWASVLALGVVCSALAFVVMFALIDEAGPARMSVITYVNPAVALLLGVAVLDEPVTAGLALGFGLILIGSWWGTSHDRPPVAGEPADPVASLATGNPPDPRVPVGPAGHG